MIGLPGPTLDAATARRIEALDPAGVILFGRNLETPQQTTTLLEQLRRTLDGPPLLALDQEGGRVSRLAPWIGPTATAHELARRGPAATGVLAGAMGRALAALGFNVDFAPVVDLCEADTPNGIGDRSYGCAPELVIEHAAAFLDGLARAGVAGCLKHFPGLGATRVDSHDELPTVERNAAELMACDLLPYRELVEHSPMVMVGHGHYPHWNPTAPTPASCSRPIIDGLLRRELGYGGLVVSDDMEMGAVGARDADGAAAVEALHAGCDLLLYCASLDRADAARDAIARRAGDDPAFAARLEQGADAVERVARRWPPPEVGPEGWTSARAALAGLGK